MIELLVTIAIIGMLIGLLLSAVQAAREASRRANCVSNMRQIGGAIQNYESAYRVYPTGGNFFGISMFVQLLPHLEQHALYHEFDVGQPWFVERNEKPTCTGVAVYRCSSVGSSENNRLDYLFNRGTLVAGSYNGFSPFWARSELPLHHGDILRGVSNFAAISESDRRPYHGVVMDNDWEQLSVENFLAACKSTAGQSGPAQFQIPTVWTDPFNSYYLHLLSPNTVSCSTGSSPGMIISPGSNHPGGVNVVLLDGSVAFIDSGIDIRTWRSMGDRFDERIEN